MNQHPLRVLAALILICTALTGCQSTGTGAVVLVTAADDADTPAAQMAQRPRAAVSALLATLSPEQRAKAVTALDAPARRDWHFIPRDRPGLPLGEMSDAQKHLLHRLVQTALSDAGYLKATDIIWLETVLAELENQPKYRDAGKYALTVFGDPTGPAAAWGWRLEGHHLNLNLTYTAEGVGVTPLFFGTNPAVLPSGPLAGKRVLSDAHSLGVQLAETMTAEQRAMMMLGEKPGDVITVPGRESSLREQAGVLATELTDDQNLLLLELIDSHFYNLEADHASYLFERVILSDVSSGDYAFAWAGPIDAGKPFYYRIHGPSFVIEYACQGPNHVHSVVHDLTDPMQEDMLRRHYERHGGGE